MSTAVGVGSGNTAGSLLTGRAHLFESAGNTGWNGQTMRQRNVVMGLARASFGNRFRWRPLRSVEAGRTPEAHGLRGGCGFPCEVIAPFIAADDEPNLVVS